MWCRNAATGQKGRGGRVLAFGPFPTRSREFYLARGAAFAHFDLSVPKER